MDEDIILPEVDTDESTDSIIPPQKTKKTKLIVICSAIALVFLTGALVYVVVDKSASPPPPSEQEKKTETIKYDDQAFNEAMIKAEERLSVKDYVATDYYLKNFSLPERMTLTQKYRYYSLLTDYYSEDYLNEPELFLKYSDYAKATLELIRKGEK